MIQLNFSWKVCGHFPPLCNPSCVPISYWSTDTSDTVTSPIVENASVLLMVFGFYELFLLFVNIKKKFNLHYTIYFSYILCLATALRCHNKRVTLWLLVSGCVMYILCYFCNMEMNICKILHVNMLPSHLYLMITIRWGISERVTFPFTTPYKGLKISFMKPVIELTLTLVFSDLRALTVGKATLKVLWSRSLCLIIVVFVHWSVFFGTSVLCESLWLLETFVVWVGYTDSNNGFQPH